MWSGKWWGRLLDLSNAERVLLQGYLPGGSAIGKILDVTRYGEVRDFERPLDVYVRSNKANVVAHLVGFGDQRGFWVDFDEGEEEAKYLPPSWWEVPEKSVYLFAYCCESSKCMSGTQIGVHIDHALGFGDGLMFWIGSKAARRKWRRIVDRMMKLVLSCEEITAETYWKMWNLYNGCIRECSRGKDVLSRSDGRYLVQLSLMWQREDMELVRRGTAWKPSRN